MLKRLDVQSHLIFVMGLILALTLATFHSQSSMAAERAAAIRAKSRSSILARFRRDRCCCSQNGADEIAWQPLFDGKSLEGWIKTNFGGEGEIEVKDGEIHMAMGSSLTGITYKGAFPKTNYEVQLEAKRTSGIDFFAAMTFPVGESHCSFVAAGWAGAVVGLSSIDGQDASDNDTTQYMSLEDDQWYRFRVRVADDAIQVWIDHKRVINQSIVGRKITTRAEVDLSKPFGVSAWETGSSLRNIQVRELSR